jgi:hypothetical protein
VRTLLSVPVTAGILTFRRPSPDRHIAHLAPRIP